MGFHKPDAGKIILGGKDVTGVVPEKRGIGYVSQKCILFPHLDVWQNVEFGLKMRGLEKTARHKTVDAVLESTGLQPLERRCPETLSGGEKQKVALARILALEPSLILLDEPLSALDAEAARDLKRALKRLHKSGKTVIHVTHNQVEGFSLGNKLAIMRQGAIVQTGQTRQVFAAPKNEFVAKFLGYENVFKAEVVEKTGGFSGVSVGGVRLKVSEVPASGNCVVGVRPEDVSVHLSRPKGAEGVNVLEGTIVDWTDQGYTVALTCDVGLTLQAVVVKSAFLEANYEEGQKVWAAFGSGAVKIIR